MAALPPHGVWKLFNPRFRDRQTLGVLIVNFDQSTGTIQYLQSSSELTGVTRLSPRRFGAKYSVGRSAGELEGELRDDGVLNLTFLGSVKLRCQARPAH